MVNDIFTEEGVSMKGLSHDIESWVDEHNNTIPHFETRKAYFYRNDEVDNPDARRRASNSIFTVSKFKDGTEQRLGEVKEGFTPIQYSDMLEVVRPTLKSLGGEFETGGIIRGGEAMWFCAKAGGDFTIKKNGVEDRSERRIIGTCYNDGKGALNIWDALNRLWCKNQIHRSKANAAVRISHRGAVEAKLEQAQEGILKAFEEFGNLESLAERMNVTPFKDKAQEYMFMLNALGINPVDIQQDKISTKKQNDLMDVLSILRREKSRTNDNPDKPGTLWQSTNAVIEYADHFKTVSGKNGFQASRVNSSMFGSAGQTKNRAFILSERVLADGTVVMEKMLEDFNEKTKSIKTESNGAENFEDLMNQPSGVI